MGSDAVWFFAVEGPGLRAEWDWKSVGEPAPRDLYPVRRPSSGDLSRHIPVTAYSVKTRSHHELESALEHELFRVLERLSDVVWLLAQPVQLHLPFRRSRVHVPDLLSLHADGSVTLWDARPCARVDELFEQVSASTAVACAQVGWRYEVFHGASSRILRLNLRWLHENRRSRPWYRAKRDQLRRLIVSHRTTTWATSTIGAVMAEKDPELLSAMWHYIWAGEIACDLEQHLRRETEIVWMGGDE
jgi:hypothetical protein